MKRRRRILPVDPKGQDHLVQVCYVDLCWGKEFKLTNSESGHKKRFTKNPNVDTSFLPDREREEEERIERELLRKQWLQEQERVKNEIIEITYSFWDGSGHRKVVEVKKGDDIAGFLGKCKAQFPELRATSVENLMYMKVSQAALLFNGFEPSDIRAVGTR